MITLIITAALLALFTATFIYFLSACLQFFDFVIKGIKGIFKAIKVLILKKEWESALCHYVPTRWKNKISRANQ